MKVSLAGPDDLGFWFLDDENGNSFPLVERHEDHPAAAALFGWKAPEGVTDEEEIINDAIDWLTDHAGEDFEAPKHVVGFFKKLKE
jgi:hypothetical protein